MLLSSLVYINYWYILLFILAAFAIGWFISAYMTKKKAGLTQSSIQSLNEEITSLKKEIKVSEKSNTSLTRERGKIQKQLEAEMAKNADLNLKIEENNTLIPSLQATIEEENAAKASLESRHRAISEKYENLHKRYHAEQKDTKAWKNEIEAAQREANDYKRKYQIGAKNYQTLTGKYNAQVPLVSEAEQVKSELKVTKKELKRLNSDLKYWEKMHFDTHHKLAQQIKEMESLHEDFSALKEAKLKSENRITQLNEMLETNKSQLVQINMKYNNEIAKAKFN